MFEPTLESVISIDTDKEIIHLYSMQNGDKNSINYFVVNYKARPFDEEFFEKLGNILKQYRENFPAVPLQKVSLLLPDSMCLMDTVAVPFMQKNKMDASLDVTLTNLYKNSANIKFNRYIASQNKQQAVYAISGMRRDLMTSLSSTCSANQVGISNITFASNAAVDGALVLNPKLKTASFVLLDVKEGSAKIILVVKGKTMGAFSLPFGYSVLSESAMAPEDLLFDHSLADLTVLNAKEKAKSKSLTVSAERRATVDDDDDDDDDESVFTSVGSEHPAVLNANGRVARKLPKYMLRETPENAQGFVYENFRIFVKWVLEVISSNKSIASLANFDKVYVNMPSSFDFLYDMVNAEREENGVSFEPLCEEQGDEKIHRNLELFGGFYAKHHNRKNNFELSGGIFAISFGKKK